MKKAKSVANCLTSETAIEILKTIRKKGKATISQVASEIGRYPAGVHWHVQYLTSLGVIVADKQEGKKEIYYTVARKKRIVAEYPFGTMTFQLN